MTKRQAPRWSEFAPLLQRNATGTHVERELSYAADIEDLRRLGRRRTPRPVFEYVDGGAGDEIAMRRARDAFDRIEFLPRVLNDVSHVDTSTTILGKQSACPFVFAPTGYTRMMHTEGESAVARVARRAGIPYALSTMGTTTPEDLAAASDGGRLWFQLYVWKDRARSKELVARARASGFDTLVLTVDVPVGGNRRRDIRNGLTIPPTLNWHTIVSGITRPRWLFDFLTTPSPAFVTLDSSRTIKLESLGASMFDSSVSWRDIDWFREIWDGPMVVKGIQTVDDAVMVADAEVDGIVLSNHGGRQLDRATTPLELLPEVVDQVGGRLSVLVDTGVRSGADVVAAVALGAQAVLVGRAYLYGLMAAGEAGVQRAFDILRDDVARTMQLLGVTTVAELNRSYVRLR
jgi:L-lactate dehydrogenase (cytochrome)